MYKRVVWAISIASAGMVVLWFLFAGKHRPPDVEETGPAQSASHPIRLQFGHDLPGTSAQHRAALRFADIVDYKSNGRVKIEVFPNQELGTDQEMLEMARMGKLAVILPPTAKMTTMVPEMQVLDLPFLFPDREELYDILDNEPGQRLLDRLKPHGLTGVAFWESGFKQFTANRPIRSPADFKGLNIRVMKSRTIMDQFRAFGANPIPIDFHKTRQALSDGVVDGQENPLVSIVNMEFYKVQSHITLSNHAYLAQALVFSSAVLAALPDDTRAILMEAGREVTRFERREIQEDEGKLLGKLAAEGMQVHTLTKTEQAAFQKACAPILDAFPKQGGRAVLEMVQAHQARKQKERENEIIIGLNADLAAGSALSGRAVQRGMALAVAEINQNGGLLGKTLRIVARDNSGLSARGRDNMAYFAGLDNLLAVMCGIYSPIALAELDVVHREKIIFLDPWAAATKIVDNGFSPNYVFRVSVRDEYAGPFLIEKALETYENVALLLVNDGWGRGNEKGMIRALARHGSAPAAVEWFSWGEKDMTVQLDAIESSGADVLVMVAGAPEGRVIIKNMAARAKKLPVISHWGITGGRFWESVHQALGQVDLSFLQSFSFFNAGTPAAKELMAAYFKAYDANHPGDIFAPVGTAHAYDLVRLLAMAVEKAGTTDRPVVRDALEQLGRYNGVVKQYAPAFTPERHDALGPDSFMLCRYNEKGHIIPMGK